MIIIKLQIMHWGRLFLLHTIYQYPGPEAPHHEPIIRDVYKQLKSSTSIIIIVNTNMIEGEHYHIIHTVAIICNTC